MWHQHLLDNADCRELYQKAGFIRHDPDGDDCPKKKFRIDSTIIAYRSRFESDMPNDVWDYVSAEEERPNKRQRPDRFDYGGSHQLFLKHCDGRTYTFVITLTSETVGDFKKKVEAALNYPVGKQILIFAGKHLEDDGRTLAEYNIQKESTIHNVLSMRVC